MKLEVKPVDVAHPIRAVVPTLDGPVLEVLARTTRPLTGREIHRLAETGSPNGVRLALTRLSGQGLVHAEERARPCSTPGTENTWPGQPWRIWPDCAEACRFGHRTCS